MRKSVIANSRGQGLVEYLIIVALMAVAAIGVMRVVSQNMRAQFATVANAIRGSGGKVDGQAVTKTQFESHDMSDFMQGAMQADGNSGNK